MNLGLTAEEKAIRRGGIFGSDISAIIGCNPYRNAFDVFREKVEGYSQPDNPDMERGRFFEQPTADWYAYRTKATLTKPSTLWHPKVPRIGCHPDFIAGGQVEAPEATWDVSIKSPRHFDGWGEPWTDQVPEHPLIQAQWEMMCTGLIRCDVVAVIWGDLNIYPVRADAELQAMLLDEGLKFLRDHIDTVRPPAIDGSESCRQWLQSKFQRDVKPLLQSTPELDRLARDLSAAKARREAAEAEEDFFSNRFRELIADAAGIEGNGYRVTWRSDKNGKRSLRFKSKEGVSDASAA